MMMKCISREEGIQLLQDLVRYFAPAKYQAIPDRCLKGKCYLTHTAYIDHRVKLGLCANISAF
jgi:hypothetical protein